MGWGKLFVWYTGQGDNPSEPYTKKFSTGSVAHWINSQMINIGRKENRRIKWKSLEFELDNMVKFWIHLDKIEFQGLGLALLIHFNHLISVMYIIIHMHVVNEKETVWKRKRERKEDNHNTSFDIEWMGWQRIKLIHDITTIDGNFDFLNVYTTLQKLWLTTQFSNSTNLRSLVISKTQDVEECGVSKLFQGFLLKKNSNRISLYVKIKMPTKCMWMDSRINQKLSSQWMKKKTAKKTKTHQIEEHDVFVILIWRKWDEIKYN